MASGDLGRIDEDGFLYIEDRAKDMVLRAGENVYCAEVESAIYDHPAIYEAAVFGVPDERLGEEVACVIQLKPDSDLSDDRAQGLPGRARWHRSRSPAGSPSPASDCPATLPARS